MSSVAGQPGVPQQVSSTRPFVVVSSEAQADEVRALIRYIFVVRDAGQLVAVQDYLLRQIQILVVQSLAPWVAANEHLNNGAAQRPDVTLTARALFSNHLRSHPLHATHDLTMQRSEARGNLVAAFLELSGAAKVAQLYVDISIIVVSKYV